VASVRCLWCCYSLVPDVWHRDLGPYNQLLKTYCEGVTARRGPFLFGGTVEGMTPEMLAGSWVIVANKVVSKFNTDDPAFEPFEAIILAGRAGELFSATRSMGTIDGDRFEAHRKIAKLKRKDAKEVLVAAEKLGIATVGWSSADGQLVEYFQFQTDSKEAVLEAAGRLFALLRPSNVARAMIDLLGMTLYLPQQLDAIRNALSKRGYEEKEIEFAINTSRDFGLLDITKETEGGASLMFNPKAFEGNAEDVHGAIKSLRPKQRQEAMDLLNFVVSNPGVPVPKATKADTLALLVRLGIIDYSKITTRQTEKGVYFPTTPYVWDVFDKSAGKALSKDLVDDSKLLLNSFRYGQFYSSPGRGKIEKPFLIVNALIRDGAIGVQKPATAIGEDYPLALSRGIVNIVESKIYSGRYSMELLKVDVAVAVREVLQQNAILPQDAVPSQEDLDRAGRFLSPSAVRVETELPQTIRRFHEEMIFSLRTMRSKR
jgi:hypothetical protein